MDRQIEHKRVSWGKLFIGIIAIGVVGLFIQSIYQHTNTDRLSIKGNQLSMDTAEVKTFKEYLSLFGTVEPLKTVYIDAVQGGKIEQILLEDGSMVEAGEQIMNLTNLDLQLSVLNQEAQIVNQINTIRNTSILMEQQSLALREQALDVDFQLDLLRKRTHRNKALYNGQAISEVEYLETQDEFNHLQRRQKLLRATIEKDSLFNMMQQQQMETTLELMNRNLLISQNSLKNLTVTAPVSGQMSGMSAEVGQLIRPGERIAQIDDLSAFRIQASVDEYYINRVFPGQEASFKMGNKSYTLILKKVYPDVQDGFFKIDLLFQGDRPKTIKRGQSIPLRLSLSDAAQRLQIAKGPYYQETGGQWIYVLSEDGSKAQKRTIVMGRQNPRYYEILEGLEPGEVVITSSYDTYKKRDELLLN